ncbi:MAG: Uma2 family endonuclease [Sandaracinus sp.]
MLDAMRTATRLATYEDLLALPSGVKGEVIRGVLRTLPAPRPRHAKVQRVLGGVIGGPFDDDDGLGGPGGWYIFPEVDVQLSPHDVVRPDLSGWRRERLADPDARPFTVVPDWVCEIASPSTARDDRVVKRQLYAEHRVQFYWLVDPETRLLEALEWREGRWVELGVFDESARVRIAPFEAVELAIGRLFLAPSATRAE